MAHIRVGAALSLLAVFFIAFMFYDYVSVMQQLVENRNLVTENKQLRKKIQSFQNKLTNLESSLERIQIFATKLRIITNQGDKNVEELKKKTYKDIPGTPMDDLSVPPGLGAWNDPGDIDPPQTYKLKGQDFLKTNSSALTPINRTSDGKISNLLLPPPSQEELKKKRQATKNNKSIQKISDLLHQDQDFASDQRLEKEFYTLDKNFGSLEELSKNVEVTVQLLGSTLIDQKDYLMRTPTLMPTKGWYTSGFGMRKSPFTNQPNMHEGLDIANHYGRPIIAPAYGIVSFAGVRPGYGRIVTIDHGYRIQTQYGHVSNYYVKEGDRVRRGQKIASVGSTGRSTGPHLHYEVRVNGIPVDPIYYILNN